MAENRWDYPASRVVEAIDTVAGVGFPDPYRWLEDDTDEVAAWQRQQNELADDLLAGWPHLSRLRDLVDHYVADGSGSPNDLLVLPPRFAGGRWFRLDGTDHPAVVVADEPTGPGRVLYDPLTDPESDGSPRHVEWISPSPDGGIVAVGVVEDGSERNDIRLLDSATGERLPDRIPHKVWGPFVAPQWLPDGSGFFYVAGDESEQTFTWPAYFHRVGHAAPTSPEPVPPLPGTIVQVAADGRHAVLTGLMACPRWVCELPERSWRPFVQNVAAAVWGVIDGDRYVAITDHDAPRGRVVAIPLDSATPDDPATWHELVPQADRVLGQIRLIGGRLVVTGSVDTEARAWVFDRAGRELEEVPLPGDGALPTDGLVVATLAPDGHPDEFVFRFSTPTSAPGLYRYRLGSGTLDTLSAPRVAIPGATVELRWAESSDGARVAYHLVRPPAAPGSPPIPTLISGYGSGRAAYPSQYHGPLAGFVASGGAVVLAHLRGGSDLGVTWADAGRLRNKQRSYDDLYAIAEHLVADGVTTAEQLAVTGWSAGGMTAAVAITQRPDLWAAAVPQTPMLDVIGAARDPYGRMAIMEEFGDLADPDEVRRLATISPYTLLRDGVDYPAVYVHAGQQDMACPPGQVRKFLARMQAATKSDAPVVARIWEGVGHSVSTGRTENITHVTHWLGFLMQQLGMSPGR